MDNFGFELKKHIDFEISTRGYGRLFETLGYPEDVLKFTRGFIDKTVAQIKNTSKDKGTSVVYTEKDFICEIPFIERYTISVDLKMEDGEPYSEGGFSDRDSVMYFKDGDIFLYPVIHIYAYGESRTELKNEIFSSVGHEMTHGYSEYMILKPQALSLHVSGNNKASVAMLFLLKNDKTQAEYYKNIKTINNPRNSFDRPFSMMAYIVSEPERRAQISELRHELENVSASIIDSESATLSVLNSAVYKNNYKLLNDNVDTYINLISDEKYNDIHHIILKSFNNVFNKNYDNVKKVAVFLNNIRNDYNRFFMNRSGKIVQDIIDNNVAMSGMANCRYGFTMKGAFEQEIDIEKPKHK